MNFAAVTIEQLESCDAQALDALAFGIIAIDQTGRVRRYNRAESHNSALAPERVVSRLFFDEVGICMNNFMVAQRFEDEACLDDIIDYVLTFRMRPTRVKLRLLKSPACVHRYILIER